MNTEEQILCIYHGNCADGFGAAWAVRHRFPSAEFHAGNYGNPPPDVASKRLILVDFSYKRPVMAELAKHAKSVLVLDHHKSAAEDLAAGLGIPDDRSSAQIVDMGRYEGTLTWERHLGDSYQDYCENLAAGCIYTLFDQSRSGAGLAWDFFHPGQQRPPLINHIEDRDLWRFALPGTREVQAALFSYPYDFAVWDELMLEGDPVSLSLEGVAIERKHHKDIAELLKVCQRRMVIAGHDVPVASLPYTMTSDAGHQMAQDEPFAACYWDTAEGRVFSLRSADDGMDVSAIAAQFGGGGHLRAAGFRVPRDHELAAA